MQRSRLLMIVLFGLFIFQSTWNLAAAYCVHEKGGNFSFQHFGHHSYKENSTDIHQANAKHEVSQFVKYFDQISEYDHDDHLPTVSHIYFQLNTFDVKQKKINIDLKNIFLDWKNLYQSPDLNTLTPPPPLVISLLVG